MSQKLLRKVGLSMKTIQTIDKQTVVQAMFQEVRRELGDEGVGVLFPNLRAAEETTSGIELFDTELANTVNNAQDGMRVLLNEGEVVISDYVEGTKLVAILNTINVQHLTISHPGEPTVKVILQEDVSNLI